MIRTIINPRLYFPLVLILSLSAMFFGCEGPEGPAGADGADGATGPAGIAGPAGPDMLDDCKLCHNNTTNILAAKIQWDNSLHATGGNYARLHTDCAPCHTSQGFLEVIVTGNDTTVAEIVDPVPQNCRTCHKIHTNYDATDWANTKTTAVAPRIAPTASIDIGKGNICAQCHQPFLPEQGIPAIDVAIDVLYTPVAADSIDSAYWGIHYGLQSTVLAGIGGWEYDGTAGYTNDAHTAMITDGCVTCHMADPPYAGNVGGHTMNVSYSYHGSSAFNLNGCGGTGCHTVGTEAADEALVTKIEATQTAVAALLGEVRATLLARDVIDDTDHIVPSKDLLAIEVGAFVNFLTVLKDGSNGVHNEAYSTALLTNTKEALATL